MPTPQTLRGQRPSGYADDEPLLLVGVLGGRVRLIHPTRRSVMELTPEQADTLAAKLFEASIRIRRRFPAGPVWEGEPR